MAGEEEDDRLLALFDSNWFGLQPSQRRFQKLCTIPSGKLVPESRELSLEIREVARREESEKKKMRGRGKSKSLSELQFEELKGFMDLGFTFSEGDSDQRLLSLVPGLQKLGQPNKGLSEEEEEKEEDEGLAARPYPSETWIWSAVDDRRNLALQRRLKSWKIPVASDPVDMKHHLRNWAHSVASSVR